MYYVETSLFHAGNNSAFKRAGFLSQVIVFLRLDRMSSNSLISVEQFSFFPRFFLKAYGVDFTAKQENRKTILFYMSSSVLGLTIVGEFIYLVVNILANELNIFQITYSTLCLGYICLAAIKMISFIASANEILILFAEFRSEHPKTIADGKNFLVPKFLRRSNRVILSYGIVMLCMINCFNFFPLITTISNYIKYDQWKVELPYTILYPFDPFQPVLFEILYFFQFWAALAAALGMVCVDTMMCCVVQLICMHFNELGLELSKGPLSTIEEKKFLLAVVERHNKLFE